jgi:pimeloyl-ACP methyl ester carboxylesterase
MSNVRIQRNIQAPGPGALLNELFTPVQFPLLFAQAPRLAAAPKGRGERVLVWPGFGAGNVSTLPLRNYLSFLGYRAEGWRLGRNNGDVLAMLELLNAELDEVDPGSPVSLVGWSLGGYLAREVARDRPDRVRRVITLGSPVIGGPKYTAVARMFARETGALDEIEALVDARYDRPLEVPVTAIFSKSDGVVAWQACIDERSPNVEHVEVVSSHAGLGISAAAYRILADRLAV